MAKRKLSFKQLESRVYHEYRMKGFSIKTSRLWARKTAGKTFWKHYGKKKGAAIIKRARR